MNFLKKALKKRKGELERLSEKAKELFSPQLGKLRVGGKGVLQRIDDARREGKPFVIAEIKRASPSKGIISENLDAAQRASIYQECGASAISVLTEDTWFLGSLEDLVEVRKSVFLPLLMKDFIVDERQLEIAANLGADMVLLISDALGEKLTGFIDISRSYGLEPLVEARSEEGILKAIECGARIVGINSRDLTSLTVNLNIFQELKPIVEKHRKDAYFIAESGIRKKEEVKHLLDLGYDGVLIGERLSFDENPQIFFKELTSLSVERE